MNLTSDDCQIAAFFGLIAVFTICERLWPARRVDWFKDLKLDVLSFAFALLVNRLVNAILGSAAVSMAPDFLQSTTEWLRSLPAWLRIVMALIVVDFFLYWTHRAQHTFGLLWRTHAWHHSIEQMYWFAGFRTSFFHSLLYNIPQVVIPVTLFQLSPLEAGIGYSIGLFFQFMDHTNWKLSFGPLNRVLVTPDYHRIHHAASQHRGRNLSNLFRVWDQLFGTYVDPANVSPDFELGLGEKVEPKKIPRMLAGV